MDNYPDSSPYHKLRNILFLDIETVALAKDYTKLDDRGQELWDKKSQFLQTQLEADAEGAYLKKAGIFAEFSKVVCISMGYLSEQEGEWQFRLKSLSGTDEASILTDFNELVNTYFHDSTLHSVCGHNIREFDVPFLCRRMIVNDLRIPTILDIRYAKPWEREHLLDTLHSWKFGDYKHYTSLDLLCHTLGVESPKQTISGGDVHDVYYIEQDLPKIARYCEQDVIAVFNVYRALHLISSEEEIVYVRT